MTPQNVHILISRTCDYVTFYSKGTLQMRLRMWGEEIILYYSSAFNVITRVLQRLKRRSDSKVRVLRLPSLKMEGEAGSQGLQPASRSRKGWGTHSPLGPPEET